MRIGIDFDNTIAIYDELFSIKNKKYKFIEKKNSNPKEILKKNLFKNKNGIIVWNKIQGSIYGDNVKFAKIAYGLKLFLILSKILNHQVFIISHKTKYGHYDKNKINLRKEALIWMDQKEFFLKKNPLIKKKNIFFCNTRKEKIEKINSLKLDYFIDDLLEILKDKSLIKNTKKIFYNRFNSKTKNQNIIKLSKWSLISDYIFNLNENKIKSILCNYLIGKKIKNFKKINIYGNSNVYKFIDKNNKIYIAKFFPKENDLKRIDNEIKANIFLKNKLNITNIVNFSLEENLVIFNYIDGVKLKSNQLIEFINLLKVFKKISSNISYKTFSPAVEACLNINQLFDQIEERMKKINNFNTRNKKIKQFLSILKKMYFCQKNITNFDEKKISFNLQKKYQILSQSDFGFHNSIYYMNKTFLYDFEYFGWDDPVKLVSDFVWHPKNKLSHNQKNIWIKEAHKIFSNDPLFKKRFNQQFIFYGIRWILIILNIYHPNKLYTKKMMYKNIETYNKMRNKQFELAKKYLFMLKNANKYLIL